MFTKPAKPTLLEMRRFDSALSMLGLEDREDLTPQMVRTQTAARLRQEHPDHGGFGVDINEIKTARDFVLGYLGRFRTND